MSTLHGPVVEACRRFPDAIALQPAYRAGSADLDCVTYAELDRRTAALAGALVAAGVGRGDVVAVCLPRGADQVVSLLAVLRAGAAFVCTEPDHPADRLRAILTDATVSLVLADSGRLAGAVPAGVRVVGPGDLHGTAELPDVDPNDPAYVIFTSGSTGRPKGSVIAHRSVATTMAWLCGSWPLHPADRVLQKISISFDVSIAEIFHPLSCGARLVLTQPGGHRDSGYLASAAARYAITVMVFVPSALDVFLLEPAARSLPALRLTMVAGEVLVPAVVDRFRARYDAELVNLYGPSECSIYATAWTCPSEPPYRPVTIGHPGPEVIAVVVDGDGAPATTGELYLGGPCVGEGYLDRPELNAAAFVADPTGRHPGRFYRTGDLVTVTPSGELEFLGRKDNQLKIRGFRVELGEITSVLLETFDLARAAVLPVPGSAGGTELHAFVVPRPDRTPPHGRDAAAALAGRLPDYMIPTRWTALDRLPVSPNGKLDSTALLALDDRPAPDSSAADPIADVWRRATGLPADDPHANLFELGGNSLTAARLLAFARTELGLDLRLDEFAGEPTLAALAKAATGDTGPDLRTFRRAGERTAPLHPAQRRLWLLEQVLPRSPAYNIVTLHRLSGPLDTAALTSAVHDVIRRHEALRTTFHNGHQVIAPEPGTGLVITAPDDLDAWATEIARTRFDVGTGPLLRVELAQAGPGEHHLVWCLHHLIADGWSLEVLWDDLAAAYEGRSRPAPVRYGDAAAWAADHPDAHDLGYWQHHLAEAPAGTALPWRGRGQGPRSRERAARIRTALAAEAIERTARQERVTAAAVALTAYAVVLARWSGQDDLVIGAPLAGRDHPALDDVVGFFNSTVALRARLSGCTTSREALHRMAGELIAAQAHDNAPFDAVVAALGRHGTPLFDVWFNVFNYADRPLRLPGLTIQRHPAPLPGALFDLGLYVHPDALELIYDTDRLDPTDAEAFLTEVHTALTTLADDPAAPLTHPRARTAPLPEPPPRRRLVDVISQHTTGIAVRAPDGEYTYPELLARSRELATGHPGTVVPITGAPTRDLPAAILGTRHTGAAFTLLDPAHPDDWRATQLRLTAPGVDPSAAYVMFTSGSTATPRAVVGTEEPVTAFLHHYAQRFALGPADVFCLLSGYGHDPVLRDLLTPLWTGGRLEIPAPEVRADPARLRAWLAAAGVTVLHLTPLMADLISAAGGPLLPAVRLTCFGGDQLPAATVRAWRALAPASRTVNFYGCTETPQAGTWHEFTDEFTEPTLPVGATGPSGHLVVLRPDGAFGGVGHVGEVCWRGRLATLGYLDDPDATARRYLPDPVGEPGVVLIRTGDSGRLRADGLVQVLGRRDGEVKVRGHRVDPGQVEAVLAGHHGVRAAAVTVVDARLGAAVVAVGAGGADGAGRARSGHRCDSPGALEREVRRYLREHLPAAMVPELVVVLDELPLTANGKLDRGRLRDRLLAEAPVERGPLPGAGVVAAIRGVWQEILGGGDIDDTANFFDLGATSLTLLRAHGHLCGALGLPADALPVIALYEHCSVVSLAAYLDGGPARRADVHRTRRLERRHDRERAVRRAVHEGVRP
jgi:amino acid adenylation domain-containing protein